MSGEYKTICGKKLKVLGPTDEISESLLDKQHVFIIGSKGIPAQYGGFETFVDKLVEYQTDRNILLHVARMADDEDRYEYNGAIGFDVKVPNIGPAKAIYYDVAALDKCMEYCRRMHLKKPPVFYILACRIGPFIGKYKKLIQKLGGVLLVNPDGHEWLRSKWSMPVREYWKISEKLMVRSADLLVCDSKKIEEYIREKYRQYRPRTTFLAYGCDSAPSCLADDAEPFLGWLKEKGLCAGEYYLVVGRFVPENNVETIIREFMQSRTSKKLALITTENEKLYGELEKKLGFSRDERICFTGSVYDQELLKKIREKAFAYLHGHSVGGTNPSLLEALGSTKLNLLLDVGFNREVGEDAALYWTCEPGSLSALIETADRMSEEKIEAYGQLAKKRIADAYRWESIASQYEDLFHKESADLGKGKNESFNHNSGT
ncbi:MAG: DUF1972 domain-containing protein [Clostridia bacterium]|nr:DUF1972 domain-containing protein [Clostridia bacterium]MBR6860327.1 DUF1972 domain-containing protein [Acidaminococcaceae bacterium]